MSAGARLDAKSEIARALIDAMERGDTPWQRPWDSRAMLPINLSTGNAYRGINRLVLALAAPAIGSRLGRIDPRWVTYRQAEANGWQVRRGERGTGIVKLVELARDEEPAADAEPIADTRFALRRYAVFSATQVDGVPPIEPSSDVEMEPAQRAESIMETLASRTNLTIVHGGDAACYVPSSDTVMLPHKCDFRALPGTTPSDIAVSKSFAYFSTALHECCHSTMAPHRLARGEAYAKRWGDEAYALEELTAQIGSAILAAETGVPMSRDPAHLEAHAAYLRSWIKAIERDPIALFTAAKAADRISEYMLGLEREWTAGKANEAWVAEYDAALAQAR